MDLALVRKYFKKFGLRPKDFSINYFYEINGKKYLYVFCERDQLYFVWVLLFFWNKMCGCNIWKRKRKSRQILILHIKISICSENHQNQRYWKVQKIWSFWVISLFQCRGHWRDNPTLSTRRSALNPVPFYIIRYWLSTNRLFGANVNDIAHRTGGIGFQFGPGWKDERFVHCSTNFFD